MTEKRKLSNCATCKYNVRSVCTSYDGFYSYKEVIIDEEVPCAVWIGSYNSFLDNLARKDL